MVLLETAISSNPLSKLQESINKRILGQEKLTERLIIALLADGHLLVEGAPGLAKTKAIKELADHIQTQFHRIQFTPDLLPSDLTGTDIYRAELGKFEFQQGPIFHNLVLADEINRAPAKVQSALLEAMAERQVTIGKRTYKLPELFLVMATQNPIEQEGTYPLPEAQLDRFLMYVKITYPQASVEQKILQQARAEFNSGDAAPKGVRLNESEIINARAAIKQVHLSDALEAYIVQLIMATRNPEHFSAPLKSWVRYGSSPRGTIALERCARAHAWLRGRDFTTPEDIHAVAHDTLRHRIILTYEAEAEGITDTFIDEVLKVVAVP